MNLKKILYPASALLAALAACLLAYFEWSKASHLSFTHDESYSYLHYVHMNVFDILSMKHAFTNNHILNSVLMKYSEILFGTSESTLRLPNILAFDIYLLYCFRSVNVYCKNLLLPFFLVLLMNPYLLDFFSLARGYGLSIGFMCLSLFHLWRFLSTGVSKQLTWFNAGALLAVLSNLTLLNYYVAALATMNIILWAQNRKNAQSVNFFRVNRINFIFIIVFVAFLYEPIRRLAKKNMLDFGGKDGFVSDTISTVINDLAYGQALPETLLIILEYAISLLLLGIFIISVLKLRQKNISFFKNYPHMVSVNLITLIIAASCIAQHYLLGNDFYIHRFALFLYPLFAFNLLFFLAYLYNEKTKTAIVTVSLSLSAVLILNCIPKLNLAYCSDWRYDADTRMVMQFLKQEHEKNPGKKISLGISWLFEPTTNFYRYAWNMDYVYPTNRSGPAGHYNYFYIEQSADSAQVRNYKTLFTTPVSNAILKAADHR
jgi:hypothetical protein